MRRLANLPLLLLAAGCAKEAPPPVVLAEAPEAARRQPPTPVPEAAAPDRASDLPGRAVPGNTDATPPAVAPPPRAVAATAPLPRAKFVSAWPAAPGGRAVTRADLADIWVFVEAASQVGTMPGPDVIYAALVRAKSPAADLVRDGSIALSGARQREGIWAFDRLAPTRGGWVATHQGPEFLSAEAFAGRAALGR
ncbi:MAG: hypothetical protein C0501_11085 [Isosphaera sp.]|nr:hypothetical protein [Isosphaera sp.]